MELLFVGIMRECDFDDKIIAKKEFKFTVYYYTKDTL